MLLIEPYNPAWPGQFREIGTRLRTGLGAIALRIDHIGSTAVPGLCAKDVIDLQITVASIDGPICAALKELGYTAGEGAWRDHVPPGSVAAPHEWEKLFFFPPVGQRRTNTHVRVQGNANARYPLLFRDYLRNHPATAEAYGELKRRLAQNLKNPDDYPDVKDPAVDLIYLAAEAWAQTTEWVLPPPDM